MSEPTSAMTFGDLVLDVAVKLGVAYYGADGTLAAAVPVDAHDLAECKRIVNNGIRMFIHDAPRPRGWRWMEPIASVSLWPSIAVAVANPVAAAVWDAPSGKTTITITLAAFYESMELRTITFTGVGSFVISDYTSSTVVKVTGNAAAAVGATWAMTATGDYTLPSAFGGQASGKILYAAGSDSSDIEWSGEAEIRGWRQNLNDSYGTPFLAAFRPMTTGTPRRRWELMVHPQPSELSVVEFSYPIHFNALTAVTETHPAPFGHDESIKAACLAVAEKEKNDAFGPDWDYYRNICLPNSYRIDASSAPRRLGYFGNPDGSVTLRQRKVVTFTP
jgi:hypothetical protein